MSHCVPGLGRGDVEAKGRFLCFLPWLGSENGERDPFVVDGTFNVHRLCARVGGGSLVCIFNASSENRPRFLLTHFVFR